MRPRRKQLRFIRLSVCSECPDYFEKTTDVWVFGDVAGYRYFQSCLERAKGARRNIHVQVTPRSNSMRVVIVPPADKPTRQARLKLIERIVCAGRKPEMELVIYGNGRGYDFLASCFEREIGEGVDDLWSHTHVDSADRELVQRSVSLNIRGPLLHWSKSRLGDHVDMVYKRAPTYLPDEAKHWNARSDPYEEIDPRWSTSLRLK